MDKITFVMKFPELDSLPSSDRAEALREIGNYGLEAILADVGETRSPVTGHMFKKLSAAYAKKKAEDSSSPVPNLELSGEMLDALAFRISGNQVEWGIWGDQAPKADGHNNFSGDSSLPRRSFIPDAKRGEKFRPEIRDEISAIIDEYVSQNESSLAFNPFG